MFDGLLYILQLSWGRPTVLFRFRINSESILETVFLHCCSRFSIFSPIWATKSGKISHYNLNFISLNRSRYQLIVYWPLVNHFCFYCHITINTAKHSPLL